eukprot:g5588.t1
MIAASHAKTSCQSIPAQKYRGTERNTVTLSQRHWCRCYGQAVASFLSVSVQCEDKYHKHFAEIRERLPFVGTRRNRRTEIKAKSQKCHQS